MSKLAARLAWPLLILPLGPLSAQILPDQHETPPEVDTITPVPPPEIPIGATADTEATIPEEIQIDNFGGGAIEYTANTGIRFAGPGVKITANTGAEVFADRAYVDLIKETVTLEGNVAIYQGNAMQRGDKTVYHYKRGYLDSTGLRASIDPIIMESGRFTAERVGDQTVFIGRNGGITTHDAEHPDYWVRADKTRVYPGEKIVFDDLKLYLGDTPVFWLPYLSQPLNSELGYHIIPGARSNWGPYLLNTYGLMLGGDRDPVTGDNRDAWLLSRWHLDIRSERGVGTGVDLVDTRIENTEEISGLSLYYTYDLDPETSRSGISRDTVDPNRYQIELKHRYQLDFPDDADWRIDSNLTYLSDQYYLEDFELQRYHTDPQPDNTIGIFRRDDNTLLSLYTRLRLNDYYRSDTRLPEITLDQARGPLFDLPVLHEGTTSFSVIGEQAADATSSIVNPLVNLSASDPAAKRLLEQLSGYRRELAGALVNLPLDDPRRKELRDQILDTGYTRFRTYHELSLPITLGGFLSVAPQAGIGYTNYSSVDGPSGDFDRTHFHLGLESSVKFAKELGKYRNHDWGLDGIMHVFQPYGSWSYIATDDYELGDPAIDRLTPTTRPRLLDPLRFTAVDQMNSWNVIRFGTRNRLLTKRDGQSHEWLYMDTYMDAFIRDPEGSRDFSNLYNDIRWSPVPWMTAELETQFPITPGGSGFNEVNTDLNFMPSDNFQFSIGYRWLSGHPTLLDSSSLDFETYTRINENWGIGTNHSIEFDDGTLENQQYTLHRDFGTWVAGMGISMTDNRVDREYGVVFSLTLKDFPSASLPFEIDAQ